MHSNRAIALASCITLTWVTPLQLGLLNQRMYIQAVYRQLTGQIPRSTAPPVALVQIDDKSVRLSGMEEPTPLDRRYLAQLLDAIVARNARA